MNKLLKKLAATFLGFAMAAGVGVAIGAGKSSAGQVRASDSGLTPSAGVFIIDFYDSEKLSSTSGTGLTNNNYSSFVKVATGLTNTDVVTSVSVTGTVRYGMNGGLTCGTGTAASDSTHYVTFNIGSDYAVNKCTVYATSYDSGRWKLNGSAAGSGSLGSKGATFANVTSPLVWNNLGGITALTFKKDNGSGGNQKRLTIYTIVCEYTAGGEDDPVSVTGVSLNKNSTSIVVGSTETLTATVSPSDATDKSVTWKSYSDSACTTESSAVASVSSAGVVTGESAGTAYVQVKTTDGNFTAKCEVTVTAPVLLEFEKITSTSDLEAGKKYIIGNEGGTYALSKTQNNNNRARTSVTISSNVISETSDTEVLVLGESNSSWTLLATKHSGYLCAVTGQNYLRTSEDPFTWDISFNSGNAVIHHSFSDSQDRIIRHNNTNSIFSCYTSGQQPITLWKEVSNDPSISFVSPTTTVSVGSTVTNTATTKNCGDSPTVNYSVTSSNPNGCATVGATTGTVTGVSAGTATIKASVTVNQTEYTATYSITVEQPTLINSVAITGAPSTEVTSSTIGVTIALSASATKVGDGTVEFTWASSDEAVATVTVDANDSTSATLKYLGNGTTSITATANFPASQGGSNVGSASITISTLKGTATNPFSVSEAETYIDTLGSSSSPVNCYVSGIVSQVDSYDSNYHSITYWISDDGTTTDQLECYSGKGLNQANFTAVTDVVVSAEVTVCGTLKKYNDVYEFNYNNYLISYQGPAAVTLESVVVSGTLSTLSYATDESWSPTGLIVTANYSDDSHTDVTSQVEWSYSPATPAAMGAGSDQTLTITASYGGKSGDYEATVTVTTALYSSSTLVVGTNPSAGSWTNSVRTASVTYEGFIYTASEGGDNGKYYSNNTSWRLYEGNSGRLTITTTEYLIHSFSVTYEIKNTGILVFNNTQYSSGSTILAGDVSSVTFGVGNTGSVSNGQVQIQRILIKYFEKPEIDYISLSGELTKDVYEIGTDAAWDPSGLVVTLHYENDAAPAEDVTSAVQWSYDPATPNSTNIESVEITATYQGETASESYDVVVKEYVPAVEDGKQYILSYPVANYYFTGIIKSGSNDIGEATNYYAFPKTDHVLEAVDNQDGTFSFEISGSKYLSWSSGNTLKQVDSIDAGAKWNVEKNSDGSVTIQNDSDNTRYLQFNTNANQQRFATYTGGMSDPHLIEVDDYAMAGNFVECYMHPEIEDNETTRQSSTTTCYDYFDDAKDYLDDHADIASTFAEESDFAAYWERYVDWGLARNYTITYSNDAIQYSVRNNISYLLITENTNTVAIIVIISMVSMTAIGGYFFLRKRKENI